MPPNHPKNERINMLYHSSIANTPWNKKVKITIPAPAPELIPTILGSA